MLTTTLRMPVRATPLLNSIMAIILISPLKISVTHTLDLPLPKDWLYNWGSWWIFCQDFLYAQDLQKSAHNNEVKSWSYIPGGKVWLNNKHIKTKKNRKLEAKFIQPFQVLHPIRKQVFMLEIPTKWRIHDMFHISLLE